MEIFRIKFGDREIKYSLESETERRWFGPMMRNKKLHEELISREMIPYFQKSECFLDIGANVGFYSVLSAVLNPSISSHAFELDPGLAAIIAKNGRLNDLSNLKVVPAAAWSNSGEFVSFSPTQENNPSTNSVSNTSAGDIICSPTISIDDYCRINKLVPDIIKLDVEGAEVRVIQALRIALQSTKALFLEIHPEQIRKMGDDINEIVEMLSANDFRVSYAADHKRSERLEQLTDLSAICRMEQNSMLVCIRD
ncbi:MAG: FkbM family methyltransferase [Puniceicoccaceae bacterium]